MLVNDFNAIAIKVALRKIYIFKKTIPHLTIVNIIDAFERRDLALKEPFTIILNSFTGQPFGLSIILLEDGR